MSVLAKNPIYFNRKLHHTWFKRTNLEICIEIKFKNTWNHLLLIIHSISLLFTLQIRFRKFFIFAFVFFKELTGKKCWYFQQKGRKGDKWDKKNKINWTQNKKSDFESPADTITYKVFGLKSGHFNLLSGTKEEWDKKARDDKKKGGGRERPKRCSWEKDHVFFVTHPLLTYAKKGVREQKKWGGVSFFNPSSSIYMPLYINYRFFDKSKWKSYSMIFNQLLYQIWVLFRIHLFKKLKLVLVYYLNQY